MTFPYVHYTPEDQPPDLPDNFIPIFIIVFSVLTLIAWIVAPFLPVSERLDNEGHCYTCPINTTRMGMCQCLGTFLMVAPILENNAITFYDPLIEISKDTRNK